MVDALAKNWWLLLLRGIAAIIFGFLAFVWPGLTLLTLVLLYGAYAIVNGVLQSLQLLPGTRRGYAGGWLLSVCSVSGPGS